MKVLGKLTDRILGGVAPKATASAVCVIKVSSYCSGTTLVTNWKDRCDLSTWTTYQKGAC